MRRELVLHAVTALLFPALVVQGRRVRQTMPRLPDASGPTHGQVPGDGPRLTLAVVGESTAAGAGADTHTDALAGHLATASATSTGQEVSWHVIARSGATARVMARDLIPQLQGYGRSDVVVVALGVNDVTAAQTGGFRHADVQPPLDQTTAPFFAADRFHPSGPGYRHWAQ